MNDEQDTKRLIKDFAMYLEAFVKLKLKTQSEMENYFNSLDLPANDEVSLKGLIACWINNSKNIIMCKHQTRNVSHDYLKVKVHFSL